MNPSTGRSSADRGHCRAGHPDGHRPRVPDRLLHGQGGFTRTRGILIVSILLPLWSGYLVKAYAWRIILSEGGILNWILDPLGLKGPGYGDVAVWLVFSYLWLPYMILPIYAGLERIPSSLLEASADLGARSGHTFRRVILPLALPAVVAGSIFAALLTLGDYIVPSLMSSSQFIGNVVYSNISVNQPLAAAYALSRSRS